MIELQSVARGCSTWHNMESIPTGVFHKGKHRNLALTCVGIVQGLFNPHGAGAQRQTHRAGRVALEHPILTRLLGHIAARSKQHSKECQT